MSDAKAMLEARRLFGPLATISTFRHLGDSNWTKQVGVNSTGCDVPYTILGEGFNTWEAAFADYVAQPPTVMGPFKGQVDAIVDIRDGFGIKGWQFWIDGKAIGDEQTMVPGIIQWHSSMPYDTTQLATGIHVICGQWRTVDDRTGRSRVYLFSTDQIAGTAGTLKLGQAMLNLGPPVPNGDGIVHLGLEGWPPATP